MSDLSVERRPRSRFDVRFASVGKQKLLVRGVAAFEINEAGEFIWGLCDGEFTPSEIAARLAARFGISDEEALGDVTEFIAILEEAGLIE